MADYLSRVVEMARLGVKYRDPAWISPGNAGWVRRFRGGISVTPQIRAAPLKAFESVTHDVFCFSYTPRPGDTIVEIGAEYGSETLFLARMVAEGGRVVAVEAHPQACNGLREMVALNGLSNVTVVQAAVGSASGETTISDGDSLRNTIGQGDLVVPAMTLKEVLDSACVERVDLLKVNIEGAEAPLFEVLTTDDSARIRRAVISCHDFRADRGEDEAYRTGASVDENLSRLGFRVARRRDAARDYERDYRYAEQIVRTSD